MMHLAIKFNKRVFWHFFAAAHGKGVVDGVGATVKRLASKKVMSAKIEIQSANDFVNSLQDISVKVLFYQRRKSQRAIVLSNYHKLSTKQQW